MGTKKLKDFTVRLIRKDGRKVTAKEARAALWAAYKIARKGGDLATEMREWTILAINWRNDDGKEYEYGSERAEEILTALGGILHMLDWNHDLRAEVPDNGA